MNKNKNEEKLIDDIKKMYSDNMTDEQKKTKRLSNRLSKKILCSKKLNNDNKIIDDNDNKIIDDSNSDFYYISIIIKLKNIVPIKDVNSILKINKKVCSQVYLEECNFINDSYNKNG